MFKFNRDEDNRWYIDLPDWEGSKDDLEMVCGADVLLDIISNNYFYSADHVYINIILDSNDTSLNGTEFKLVLNEIQDSGATYYVHHENISTFEIWLCDVTKFVFNEFPELIFFKV